MRILVYVPLDPAPPAIYPQTQECIMGLDWDEPYEIMYGREDHPTDAHPYENITKKFNHARDLALCGGYDALLTIESDMLVPPDTIRRLVAVKADVAYGLYVSRHRRRDGFKWLAFYFLGPITSMSHSARPLAARKLWGKVQLTDGTGMGCTLIRRPVLEAIQFRCHPEHRVSNDWMLSLDCKQRGFTQAHDFGLVCGHIMDDAHAIWPTVSNDQLWEIRNLDDGLVEPEYLDGGRQVRSQETIYRNGPAPDFYR
jgi:hypothetical protein